MIATREVTAVYVTYPDGDELRWEFDRPAQAHEFARQYSSDHVRILRELVVERKNQ